MELKDRYSGRIDVLLGGDVAAKLITGKKRQLKIETLHWMEAVK